jgi:U3 small nucleolar RNA-associated protein 14
MPLSQVTTLLYSGFVIYIYFVPVKLGWGDWAGPGTQGMSVNFLKKRERALKKAQEDIELLKKTRKDTNIDGVIISEERNKLASKYKVAILPKPYLSHEEYQRSLQVPLGGTYSSFIFLTVLYVLC